MTIFEQLKEKHLQLRKEHNSLVSATSALIGDLEQSRRLSDEAVINVTKTHVANLKIVKNYAEGDALDAINAEIELLESFIPPQLNVEQIKDLIKSNELVKFEQFVDGKMPGKFIGQVQGFFKKNYAGQYSGTDVVTAIEQLAA